MKHVRLFLLLVTTLFGALFLFVPMSAHAALYNASGVLGQPDFTSSDDTVTQAGMNYPTVTSLDTVNHRLFVADNANNRVLVFQLDSSNNVTTSIPAYVLGQADFTSSTTTTTQSTLHAPWGLAYESITNRLFVADQNNQRVMVFDVNPSTIANGENASYVLGQPDFNSDAPGITQNTLNGPDGVALDTARERLFVDDDSGAANGNRVMVFDVNPSTIANGENASYVLGQPDFTSNTATTTQSGLHHIQGIVFDPGTDRIFVGNYSQTGRVMVFDVNPSTIANGENALNVIGEPDFTSDAHPATQSGLWCPDGLALDVTTETLFVADDCNNRVMIFNVATSTIINGENAFNVLGQPDFTSSDSATSQSGLTDPDGDMAYDPGTHHLYVPDSTNNRVLQFIFISLTTSSLPDDTVGTSYNQALTTENSQGSVSFALYSGSLPAGLTLATSTGVISGTPTGAGTSSFTIEADDGFSTGNFFDRKDYTITVAAAPTPTPSTRAPSNGPVVGSFSGTFQTPLAYYAQLQASLASSTATSSSPITPPATPSPGVQTATASSTFVFVRNLRLGSIGSDVNALQTFLISEASGGAASHLKAHGTTLYFGTLTFDALQEFQEKVGIMPASGFFGPITRAYVTNLQQ